MKKSIIGAAIAMTALMASSAFADVVEPSTGNGELTLFVKNTTTGEVYARGLQIQFDTILPLATASGAYSGPTTIAYSLPTIGPDANLASFLTTGSTAEFKWGVLIGDSFGTNAVGTRRFGLSTIVDLTVQNPPSNTALGTLGTSFNSFFTALNSNLPDVAGSSVRGSLGTGGLWDDTGTIGELADTFFNTAPNQAYGALGDSNVLHFFAVTSAGGGNAIPARVFQFSDIALAADGTLHAVGGVTPVVPIPAAVWLFGSGILGLLGIGRRKNAVAA